MNTTANPSPAPMSPSRMAFVTILIFLLIGVHALEILKRSTHWPFGHYEMFSHLSDRWEPRRLAFVGETADHRELALTAPEYSAPLPSYHTRLALENAIAIHDRTKRDQTLGRLFTDCLRRYNAHRISGDPAWPELTELRLYELSWNAMDPWARNAANPDRKDLIFTFVPSSQPAPASEGRTQK